MSMWLRAGRYSKAHDLLVYFFFFLFKILPIYLREREHERGVRGRAGSSGTRSQDSELKALNRLKPPRRPDLLVYLKIGQFYSLLIQRKLRN